MKNSTIAQIDGGIPLVGSVKISGSRTLALKCIYASVIGGEECVFANVPKAKYVADDLEIMQSLGVEITWVGANKLAINSGGLNDFVIKEEKAQGMCTVPFLVPALIHKFGKAVLPKCPRSAAYAEIWQAFGIEVREDNGLQYAEATKLQSGQVILPYKSRILTDMAILTALFVLGESVILNPSTDVETDDLIEFCNKLGGEIVRQDDTSILVNSSGVFKGVNFTLPYDREEAAFFILATLLTHGNTTILDLERSRLLPFFNWLSKVGAAYEFCGRDMRVWHNSQSPFTAAQVSVAPHPGFITDFAPLVALFSCFAAGESTIHKHISTPNTDYIKELNRLGAGITTEKIDDILEFKISGGVKLKPGRLHVDNLRYALVYLLYALTVEGPNVLTGYQVVQNGFESITER
ncbi:hypothetical protein KKG63_02600, partial [Patescibacteria group bacterium]|nr:hypothetical protein [Patescibacteria group bacterium]